MNTSRLTAVLVYFASSLLLLGGNFVDAREIVVAKTGSDANAGSLAAPYLTIAKAAAVAQPGDVVNIRAGTYEEMLAPTRSGTAASPITFQSYQNEKVVITAMQAVSGWTLDAGSVYKTTIDWDLGESNFVMHNATALDLARWPNNTDGLPFTKDTLRNTGGSAFDVSTDAHLDYASGIPNIDWSQGGSVYFYGDKPGSGWIAWKAYINQSSATQVRFDVIKNPGWILSAHAPADKGEFFLEGVRGALDYQNEWYFDSASKTVYVQLPGGAAPQNGAVKMRRRVLTIDLHNLSYINIKDLAVFGGSINVTGNASNNVLSGISSFYGNATRGVFSGFLSGSQSVYMQGTNNTLQHSEIGFGTGSGVRESGVANQILNSYIHDFNILGSYDAVLLMRGGRDTIARNNTIARGGRDAVQSNHRNLQFSYNDVSQSNLVADDCGLFYAVGGPYNMELHHNWFHDAYSSGSKFKAAGIYLDNNPDDFSVHHNVVWNTEWANIQMNWNANNIDIYNNTLLSGSRTMGAWHREGTSFSDVRVWNNLSAQDQWEPQSDRQNNLKYAADPFVARANNDFSLKANSEPVDIGRVIAGITDNVTDNAPDVGAYEQGQPRWVAGVSWDISSGAANRCYELPGEVCDQSDTPPPPPPGNFLAVPGTIQAEDYDTHRGTQTLPTLASEGGGSLVGHIENGDYIEFAIVVEQAGTYMIDLRVASATNGGNIEFFSDSNPIGTVVVGTTNGWRTWDNVQGEMYLEEGQQRLRLVFNNPNESDTHPLMNVNWFTLSLPGSPPQAEEPMMMVIPAKNGKTVIFEL